MDMASGIQIFGVGVCISHSANTIEKSMNPAILPLAVGKIKGQTELFSLGIVTGLG